MQCWYPQYIDVVLANQPISPIDITLPQHLQNTWSLHALWQGPYHAVVVLSIGYYQLGPAVFSAAVYVIFMIPLEAVIAKIIAHYR